MLVTPNPRTRSRPSEGIPSTTPGTLCRARAFGIRSQIEVNNSCPVILWSFSFELAAVADDISNPHGQILVRLPDPYTNFLIATIQLSAIC
jgi:hypothetical protein